MSETVRIGERQVPIESLRPAGTVFDASRKRQLLKRVGPPKVRKKTNYIQVSKLTRLADFYRPHGTDDAWDPVEGRSILGPKGKR